MFGPATHVYYVGGYQDFDDNLPSLQSHDQVRVERHWSGVFIEYESGGEVGKVDLITTMMAITNAFVLIGMATAIVDNIGQLISARFYDDKYEDDGGEVPRVRLVVIMPRIVYWVAPTRRVC